MDYLDINKQTWDKRTQIHVDSAFYDRAGFVNGDSSLNAVELAMMGDVSGKSLLHLQCHFGMDSLSWARLGAEVTGVDLSDNAISEARKLADECAISAEFVAADIYQYGETNQHKFDRVFTSYGVLCWLPDMDKWAKVVADALVAGGEFHMVEFHPAIDLHSGYSYFAQNQPDVDQEGTYTENCDGEESTIVVWPHPLSEVITALINAGLSIDSFSEHPFSPYNCLEGLEMIDGSGYQLVSKEGHQLPLLYSIKATKQG